MKNDDKRAQKLRENLSRRKNVAKKNKMPHDNLDNDKIGKSDA